MRRLSSYLLTLSLALTPFSARAESFSGIAEVLDGDTIVVEGVEGRIRIHGIDAPEGSQRCADADGVEFRCGARSSDSLSAIIGPQRQVACEVVDIDRWGRRVARCLTPGGTDIGAEIVRQGWAIDYARYSNGAYAEEELEARRAGRGLWAGEFTEPEEWRRLRRR